MNEQDKLHLSGFLDNDVASTDSVANEPLLKKISHDMPLRSVLQRYQYIGEIMRGSKQKMVGIELSEKIRQKIQAEPPILAPQKKAKLFTLPSWTKPAAGGAIAAALSLIVFNGFNSQTQTSLTTPQFASQNLVTPQKVVVERIQTASPAPSIMMVSQTQDHWITDNKTLESRFNRYLIQHSENASQAGIRNVLPYVNFISYDDQ